MTYLFQQVKKPEYRRGPSSHFITNKKLLRNFRRVPLTADEIESINGGGAAAATAAAEICSRAAEKAVR